MTVLRKAAGSVIGRFGSPCGPVGACWGPRRGRSRLRGAMPVSPGASREGFTCWASEWSCDPGATTLQAARPSQTFLPAPRKGQARPPQSPDFRCGACLSHPYCGEARGGLGAGFLPTRLGGRRGMPDAQNPGVTGGAGGATDGQPKTDPSFLPN